jgi:transcriptional regulator with XRE-family HTH domain
VNNDKVQAKLTELKQKGWTLANIAREVGQAIRTVESWNQGKRSPANLQSVLASLDKLDKIKRIPKKKIYAKGSHQKRNELPQSDYNSIGQ